MKAGMRIGIYGGAFDPPHNAHLGLARAAVEQLGLDILYVIPTGQPWMKQRRLTAAEHRLAMARLWVDTINRHGGDAQLVHLPEIGIRGNTHFLMSDLNNVQIANLISAFLAENGLDQ